MFVGLFGLVLLKTLTGLKTLSGLYLKNFPRTLTISCVSARNIIQAPQYPLNTLHLTRLNLFLINIYAEY